MKKQQLSNVDGLQNVFSATFVMYHIWLTIIKKKFVFFFFIVKYKFV